MTASSPKKTHKTQTSINRICNFLKTVLILDHVWSNDSMWCIPLKQKTCYRIADTDVPLSRSLSAPHTCWAAGTLLSVLFLQALHVCWGLWMPVCMTQKMLLTHMVLRSCVTRLVTILNITNHTWLSSWHEPVAIYVSRGRLFIILLDKDFYLQDFCYLLNIISICFVHFCHNSIPTALALCVSVGVRECLLSPCYAVTHRDIDLRASFLLECFLRGPKV